MAAGFDIFRTSNDRQNIAQYGDRSVGFALRAGWAFTEHTRQTRALHAAPVGHLQRPALGLVDRAAPAPARRWCRKSPQTIGWDTRDSAPHCDQGLAAAQHPGLRWPERHASSTCARRSTAFTTRASSRTSSPRSAARSAPSSRYDGSTLRLNNRFFIGGDTLRGFAGRRHRSARLHHDQLARRHSTYYTGHRRAQLPARLAQGDRSSSARPSSTSVRCGDPASHPIQAPLS